MMEIQQQAQQLLSTMSTVSSSSLSFILSGQQAILPAQVQELKPKISPKVHDKSSPLPIKPAKKLRTEDNTIQRCKRRLDFAPFGLNLNRPKGGGVVRRNERERNRVKTINSTFDILRQHLPGNQNVPPTGCSRGKAKKMSKVDTLRGAIEYIQGLQELILEHDALQANFPSGQIPADLDESGDSLGLELHETSGTTTPASSPIDIPLQNHQTVNIPSQQQHQYHFHPVASPGNDSDGMAPSPGSTYSSDVPSEPPLSPEEEDLLDFYSWFDLK